MDYKEKDMEAIEYLRTRYYAEQIDEIMYGLKIGVDASIYANPDFNADQMSMIRCGLQDNVDVSVYANAAFDYRQMNEIRSGLVDGLDVSSYADPKYDWTEMKKIRKELRELQGKNIRKIAINTCYGGFSLSPLAIKEIMKREGKDCFTYYEQPDGLYEKEKPSIGLFYCVSEDLGETVTSRELEDFRYYIEDEGYDDVIYSAYSFNDEDERDYPLLTDVIEELGEKANGTNAKLKVVSIPEGVIWCIREYDGIETVEERHRSWC
jgi:hypothetical protein